LRNCLLLSSKMSPFHIFLLLNLISFLLRDPQTSNYDLCMHTTWAGSIVTRILLFHTYCSCAGTVIGACTHNHTTYLVCSHGDQHICFNPTHHPQEQWLEIWSVHSPGNLVSRTQVFNPDKPVSMFFEACVAIDQGGCGGIGCGCGCVGLAWERAYMSNDKYMCKGDTSWPCNDVGSYYCPYWGCVSWATWQKEEHCSHKGTAAPDCTPGTCNPINFTVLKPSN
jgi:hypothetical protein